MNFHNQTVDEVFAYLSSNIKGLTSKDAQERLNKYGKNKLAEGKKESTIRRFLKQLAEPMTIILIIAAAISAGMEIYEGASSGHFGFPADVVIILAVVLINAILGVLQESKAEKAIEALQEISGATSKVIRDGRQITIRSEELVVGDIIVLEAGDAVPADARLIECASIKAEEAALTGESVPVNKIEEIVDAENVPLGDRKNMVYMGSIIVYGRGKAVVTQTGMDTEMGSNISERDFRLKMSDSRNSPALLNCVTLNKSLKHPCCLSSSDNEHNHSIELHRVTMQIKQGNISKGEKMPSISNCLENIRDSILPLLSLLLQLLLPS